MARPPGLTTLPPPKFGKRLSDRDLQDFSVDDRGALYWKDRRIKADIGLTKFQERLAVTVAIITVLSLLVGMADVGFKLYDRISGAEAERNDSPPAEPATPSVSS